MSDSARIKKLIFSSSNDPNNTNPANFDVNFGNSDFAHGNIAGMLLVDINIPNMFYNINESNRRVVIKSSAAITYVIDMPLGQYTVTQYMDEFTLQLAAASGGAFIVNSYAVDPITGVLDVDFNLIYEWPVVETLGQPFNSPEAIALLGMNPNGSFFSSPELMYPPNFSGEKEILINTTIMASNTTLGTNNAQETIVDFVSLADTCYGTCKWHHAFDQEIRHHVFPNNTSIQHINFILTDIHGRELTLPANVEVTAHIIAVLRKN